MKLFIHVGSGKAASTTLQEYFRTHPQIFSMTDFWQHQIQAKSSEDLLVKVYSDETIATHANRDTIGCRFHKDGFFERSESNAKALATLFPSAEILFVTREDTPDTLHSNYATAVLTGYEQPYEDFVGNKQINDWRNMPKNIEIWARYFSKVHVLEFEELKSDAEAFYAQLNKLLGITPLTTNTQQSRRLNVRLNSRQIAIARLMNKVANRTITRRNTYFRYLRVMGRLIVRL